MKYENLTDETLWIPGVGEVEAHGIIESSVVLNNQNLRLLEERYEETDNETNE